MLETEVLDCPPLDAFISKLHVFWMMCFS